MKKNDELIGKTYHERFVELFDNDVKFEIVGYLPDGRPVFKYPDGDFLYV